MVLNPNETYRRFSEQAKRLPTRPNVSTIWRWALKGVRGVILESVLIGGIRHCSDEAIERFLEEVNRQAELRRQKRQRASVTRNENERERLRTKEKAMKILRQAGLLPDDAGEWTGEREC